MKKTKNKDVVNLNFRVPDYTIIKNSGPWRHRVLIGTATTGLVRMEWVHSRYGQVIPTNWSQVDMTQYVGQHCPMEYLVADAQNLIVKHAIENNFEFVLFWEHDNIAPQDAFIRLNEYMRQKKVPIVSGLYFTKSNPPEPLVYRGRGNSYYKDWKLGDLVWADGVPTGFLLIDMRILKALWDESPEYVINGQVTRRVFEEPARLITTPTGNLVEAGTSDLKFCERVMQDGIFTKAGFPEYEGNPFPFLVDTNLFVGHVDQSGRIYPIGGIPDEFKK